MANLFWSSPALMLTTSSALWLWLCSAALGRSATPPFTILGSCRHSLTNVPSFNFEQHFNDSRCGRWHFQFVSDSVDNERLAAAYLQNARADDGAFYTQIFGKQFGEDTKELVTETLCVEENGVVTLHPVGTTDTIRLYFMCYESGEYAYYLACSDHSDYDIDSRFIITYGDYQLSEGDWRSVRDVDQRHQFRTGLRRLAQTDR